MRMAIHLGDRRKQVNQAMKLNMSLNNNMELQESVQNKVVIHFIVKKIVRK